MSRRRRRPLPEGTFPAVIEDLSQDGRGVTHRDGKAVFIDDALPGETVTFAYTGRHRHFDEGRVAEILTTSADRIEPACPHFGTCGGCSLQHLRPEAQRRTKQAGLLETLRRIGHVEPEAVAEPITGPIWGYRRKARLGVRFVPKKGRVLVGFRERRDNRVADLETCPILAADAGRLLPELAAVLQAMAHRDRIPQLELAIADRGITWVVRHREPLPGADRERLRAFAQQHGVGIQLQSGGPETVTPLEPETGDLSYTLPEFDLELGFAPLDFIQVNGDANRALVSRAVAWLDPTPEEHVLDLFCGLGNFALPLARRAGQVWGLEGDPAMVGRAAANARANGVTNAQFHAIDLEGASPELLDRPRAFDKALLDPPRSGAEAVLPWLARQRPSRLVYVSCHPATLARDAGQLVHRYGYRLRRTGIADLFPHTNHVESIALFEAAD